ncbi:MAG: TIGR02300 family protein [Alphaproteobacteria bacterium]
MVKQEWGFKRACQGCGARFYDLAKSPIICPKCKSVFDPEFFVKSRRSSRASAAQVVLKDAADSRLFDPLAEDDGIVFPVEEVEMGDDVLIEDTSDLGGEDEVVEVIDHRNEDNV